jgi:hypothetical protein
MSSENPSPAEVPPADVEAAPEPQPVEEPVIEPAEGTLPEEEYEELIEPEKPRKPRKKTKHLGAIITVIVILVILVLWTVLGPRLLPVEGTTYVNSSTYANLGSFNETLKSWAATTNWGISVSTPDAIVSADNATVAANQTITILVLVSKVSEKPGNFWFRGTAVSITNMTLIDSDSGVIVSTMTNKSHLGYGEIATLKFSLKPGNYNLSLTGQFLVYVGMRIGFLPVEKINLEPFELEKELDAR